MGRRVIDARARFAQRRKAARTGTCRFCSKPGTTVVLPRVDHRKRKPWPQPYWLCDTHKEGTPS